MMPTDGTPLTVGLGTAGQCRPLVCAAMVREDSDRCILEAALICGFWNSQMQQDMRATRLHAQLCSPLDCR